MTGGEWVNAKTQGRNEKGIPAYAGMTGGVAGYDVRGAGVGGMTGGVEACAPNPQRTHVIPAPCRHCRNAPTSFPRRRESGGGREGFRRGVVLGRLWRLRVRYLVRGRRLRRLSVGSRCRGMRLGWPVLLRG